MKINIEIGEGKKFDFEGLKKYAKPVFWYGSWRVLNGTINSITRPGRSIGYLFNAVLSGELAGLLTYTVFRKKDEEVEEKDYSEPEADTDPKAKAEDTECKSWSEVIVEKEETVEDN